MAFPKGISQPRSRGKEVPSRACALSPQWMAGRGGRLPSRPPRESARSRSSGLRLPAGEGPSRNCCHLLPPPLPLHPSLGEGLRRVLTPPSYTHPGHRGRELGDDPRASLGAGSGQLRERPHTPLFGGARRGWGSPIWSHTALLDRIRFCCS